MFPSVRVISGSRKPFGYQQITSLTGVVALTVPTPVNQEANYCVIQCEGATTNIVRWRDDGTNPTTSVGMLLFGGQEMDYSGDLNTIRFIDSVGSSILNVSYYT